MPDRQPVWSVCDSSRAVVRSYVVGKVAGTKTAPSLMGSVLCCAQLEFISIHCLRDSDRPTMLLSLSDSLSSSSAYVLSRAPFLCAVTATFYSHVSSLMCAKCVTISLSLSSCLFSRCPIILFHSVHPTFFAVTSLDLVIAQSPLPRSSSSLRHPSWVKTSRGEL